MAHIAQVCENITPENPVTIPNYRICGKLDNKLTYTTKRFPEEPGLIDPLAVVQRCVPVLSAGVYAIRRAFRDKRPFDLDNLANDDRLCEGLRIYLVKWEPDCEIEKAVEKFIKYPCVMDICGCIQDKPQRALQFLTSYLRQRGPLINWVVNEPRESMSTRCMTAALTSNLRTLNDLEFTSAVVIGRYLRYLLSIAYSHGLFYVRTLISQVWGPVFLKVTFSPELRQPGKEHPQECVDKAVQLFFKIVESAPWSHFIPFEGVDKTLMEDPQPHFVHYLNEGSELNINLYRIPPQLEGSMSDVLHKQIREKLIKDYQSNPQCANHVCQFKQEQLLAKLSDGSRTNLLPDECQIKYC